MSTRPIVRRVLKWIVRRVLNDSHMRTWSTTGKNTCSTWLRNPFKFGRTLTICNDSVYRPGCNGRQLCPVGGTSCNVAAWIVASETEKVIGAGPLGRRTGNDLRNDTLSPSASRRRIADAEFFAMC
jgi:hypothetical protein